MFFCGFGCVYGDIQQVLEVLENVYCSVGYIVVQVSVLEQELIGGVVCLQVVEMVVGKVVVSDNCYFSEQNICVSILQLVEGSVFNLWCIFELV